MQSSQSHSVLPDQAGGNEGSRKGVNAKASGNRKRNYSRLQMAIDSLNIAKNAAEIIQVPLASVALKGTCGMAISILEAVIGCKKNRDEWEELAEIIKEKTTMLVDIMESSQKNSRSYKHLEVQIQKYMQTLDTISNSVIAHNSTKTPDSGSLKDLWHTLSRGAKEAALRKVNADEITSFGNKLQALDISLRLSFQVQTNSLLEEMASNMSDAEQHALISGLDTTPLANGDLHQRCMSGTRESILARVRDWSTSDNSPPVFWLADVAGTGKSTIANHLAREWKNSGHLAGRFFFSREADETRTSKLFFSTIAQQGIANLGEDLQGLVAVGIRKLKDPLSATLDEQFTSMFWNPLRVMKHTAILVLDALDECESISRKKLIDLILPSLSELPYLRLFITSRPETYSESSQALSSHIFKSISDDAENSHDVEIFLQESMKNSPLQTDHVQKLIERANGLFIWASTACKIVGSLALEPEEIMDELMGPNFAEMDALYSIALKSTLSPLEIKAALLVLGVILVANEPLSPASIDLLLRRSTSDLLIRKLSSVLRYQSYDDPVRFLHPTFREYLLRRRQDDQFYLDEPEAHLRLASDCLSLMQRRLEYNICQFGDEMDKYKDEFQNLANDPDVKAVIDANIPHALRYACRFWAFHFASRPSSTEKSRPHTGIVPSVVQFFESKFLDWLSVLSIINRLYDAPSILDEVKASSEEELNGWCEEAPRIIQAFYDDIRKFPLAIYQYVIPSLPRGSQVLESYVPATTYRCPSMLWGIPLHWNPNLGIPFTEFFPCDWKFSSNGDWIAMGGELIDSYESQIGLWNLRSGIGFQWRYCEHDDCSVDHVSFHKDSTKLKACCDYGITSVWDISTLHHDKTPEWQQEFDEVLKWSEDGYWVCVLRKDEDRSVHLYDALTSTWTKLLDPPHPQNIVDGFFILQSQKCWIALQSLEEGERNCDYSLIHFWDCSGRRIWSCMDGLYIPIDQVSPSIDQSSYPTKYYDLTKDGKYIAFYACSTPTSNDHNVHMCACENGEIRRLWHGPTIQGRSVTLKFFSQRGELMLMIASPGTEPGGYLLSVYAATNNSLQQFISLESFPFKIEISSDGNFAAMEFTNRVCKFIMTENLTILGNFNLTLLGFLTDVVGVCDSQLVTICPVGSSFNPKPPPRRIHNILSMSCSMNCTLLATGDQSGLLVLWKLISGERLYEYKMDGELHRVMFSADSSLLLLNLRGENMGSMYVLHITSYELTEIWKTQYEDYGAHATNAHCLDAIFFPQTNRIASIHVDSIFRVFVPLELQSYEETLNNFLSDNNEVGQFIISNDENHIATYQFIADVIHCWSWQGNQVPFQLRIDWDLDSDIDIGFSGDSTRVICLNQLGYLLKIYIWAIDDQSLQLRLHFNLGLYTEILNPWPYLSRNETSIMIQGWTSPQAKRQIWKLDCISGNLTEDVAIGHPPLELHGPYLFHKLEIIFRIPLLYQDYTCNCIVGNYVALGYDDGKIIVMDCSSLIQEDAEIGSMAAAEEIAPFVELSAAAEQIAPSILFASPPPSILRCIRSESLEKFQQE